MNYARAVLGRIRRRPGALFRASLRWMPVAVLAPYWSLWLLRPTFARISLLARVQGGRQVRIGSGSEVDRGVIIEGEVAIGRFCQINQNTVLRGRISVGNCVMIANNVTIAAGDHRFDRLDIPMRFQGSVEGPIEIASDVWIGASATVCKGVKIGAGAIVGAGAVVTRPVPPLAIVTGIPARVVRFRSAAEKGEST